MRYSAYRVKETRKVGKYLRKREWLHVRSMNTGVFLVMPDAELENPAWEAELEARVVKARATLVEFRELIRAGRPLPEVEAEKKADAAKVVERLLDKVERLKGR